MKVLIINCGSSSFKYQLMEMTGKRALCAGLVERIGEETGTLIHKAHPGTDKESKITVEQPFPDHATGMRAVVSLLVDPERGVIGSLADIGAVGHRVVMGGELLRETCVVGEKEKKAILDLASLAPLHNPANLQGIEVAQQLLPHAPSVAVFDTEFHTTMEAKAFMYALPYGLYEKQRVRGYGFHGTSHRYVSREAAKFLGKKPEDLKIITCHLGNGCSMAAVQGGRCVDTSMGLTPLSGLVMGTRCGDVDPALHLFLSKSLGLSFQEVDVLLNKQSGLKGLCGFNDMRDIHAARAEGDSRAQLAFDVFCYRVKKYIGAYYAVLGGLDALVFTAGIGENDSAVRETVCTGLNHMGIAVDREANARRADMARAVSPEGAGVSVLVVPTNEELEIAQATLAVLGR